MGTCDCPQMRLTKAQAGLATAVGFLFLCAINAQIPGGVVRESVDLGFEDIIVTTWPWALSVTAIAAILWHSHLSGGPEPDGITAVCLGILVAGCVLGFMLVPEFELTAEQAADPQYVWFAEGNSAQVVKAGSLAAHNPKATAVALAFGIAILIVFLYGVLYGPLLWLSGAVAGVWFGRMIAEAFLPEPSAPGASEVSPPANDDWG